jgi:membrane protein YqaA with SNARE-associated domain
MFVLHYMMTSKANIGAASMPYREKIAWLSLVGMAICYGPYFAVTHQSPLLDHPLPNFGLMALFAAAAGGNAVWVLLGRLLVNVKTPRDERAVADERDRAVDRRAGTVAYYVLIGLALYVGCVLPFTSTGWHIVNSMIASVVIAETIRYAVIVLGYRRGLR